MRKASERSRKTFLPKMVPRNVFSLMMKFMKAISAQNFPSRKNSSKFVFISFSLGSSFHFDDFFGVPDYEVLAF